MVRPEIKSTVEQIRARFDADVERFSNLETGQTATMDAPLVLEIVARTAIAVTPHAVDLLDIGCGAGNWTLRLMAELRAAGRTQILNAILLDLSRPMLERAVQRVSAATPGRVTALQGDIREVALAPASADVIVAAAVLHHLRTDAEWEAVFAKCFAALRPGGSFWISDYICYDDPAVQAVQWRRFGEYLVASRGGAAGEAYRDKIFAYIDAEDTPRSSEFQTKLLSRVGFADVTVLHKNAVFAALGGVRRA